ncbi:MarR family transcriptional regulator [Actinospica sp. MGRD01-02]|uniref:MarR family transcriptional regulator n=1 Tax=Actinospica acidithermotolerans TaxID=2828514 RepID=A0A941EHQ3_9ACTN|nr:MarR family transcriptional regulator [Actinospica acidithermotolerans]MBR7829314.1 MarR family transcriptional regulator [Actinospica acidithermotolerans]
MARQRHGSSDALVDELFETTVALRTFAERRLRPAGSSVARLRALRMLAREAVPLRMRDLSEMLGIAARTTTTIVDSLEQDGLVERVRQLDDRRAFLITLTESGRAHYEQAEAMDARTLAEATGTLTGAEREQLRALLAKVRTAVAQAS